MAMLIVMAGPLALVRAPAAFASLTGTTLTGQTPNPVAAGSQATFTANVTNSNGSSDRAVSITALVTKPTGATLVSSQCVVVNGDGAAHAVTFVVGTTSATTSGSLTVTVQRWQNTTANCSGSTSDAITSSAATLTVATGPTVTGVAPASGTAAGGTSVVITGTNFTGTTGVGGVKFGGTNATSYVVNSATQITAVAPVGTANSQVDVTVTNAGNTSATSSADKYTYASTPTVTSLGTTDGALGGGTSVAITGTNFSAVSGVKFGATAASSFTVNSATSITATAPAGSAGTVDVTVTNTVGTSSAVAGDHFTYWAAPTVSAVNPAQGPTTAGTAVSITGTNFSSASSVKFGSTSATGVVVNSTTSISATAPAGSAGQVDVTVTAVGGTSTANSGDKYTYVNAPSITSVSPNQGPLGGGTSVTITGANLSGATAVAFGSVAATTFTPVNSTTVTATAPAQAAGQVDVRVTTIGGQSVIASGDHFTYVAAPAVTAIAPATGPAGGGTQVSITGSNLTGASAVSFGGVPALNYTVNSATSITAVSPAGSGLVDITVTTVGGTSTTGPADQFTYDVNAFPTVTAVSPASGTTVGGTTVTITGTNFTTTGAVVSFGGTNATTFTVVNNTTITVTAPARSAGLVEIAVSNSIATSLPNAPADQFTYVAPPSVSGLSPASGIAAGGTSVTISGSAFTGATVVKFGSTSVGFTVNDDSTITATAPAGTADTSVDVTVVAPGGTSTTSSADKFTWVTGPTVGTLSPTDGPLVGGGTVTITGTHFSGVDAVKFGSAPATSFVVNSTTQITAVAPAGTGTVDVVVHNAAGNSAAGQNSKFSYVAAPTVTGVSPSGGALAGGTSVTITGTNFVNASQVLFGSSAGFGLTLNGTTSITVTSPSHAAGIVDITVVADGGTSAVTSADQFTYAAVVTGVTSSTANGNYPAGASISIQVAFSAPVTVTGTPLLALNDGGSAAYASGSGTSTLTFTYVVAGGQNTGDLDELSASALTLNGGTIQAGGADAILTVAAPQAAGSLGANKAIVIDTTPPTVSNVTSSTANGTYGTTASISIQVAFSENVTVTGTPQLALNSGGTASYASGSGTSTLTFNYTVAAGQSSADLDAASTAALTGTIKDATGNLSANVLPTPGGAGSLGTNKSLAVDTGPHTCQWTGSSSTSWTTATNWINCANVAPQAIDSVVVPNTTRDPVVVTTTVAGIDVQSSGLLTSSSSTTLTDTGDFTIDSGGTFTFSAGTVSVGGDFTDNGTLTQSSNTSIAMTGGGSQVGGSSAIQFHGLTINPGAGGVVTLASNVAFPSSFSSSASLTVSSGTFDLSTFTANASGSSGTRTLSVAGGATLKVGASNFPTGFSTSTLNSGSTVEYDAAGNQTVSNAATYGTLKISGSGTKTLAGTTVVAGNLDIEGGTLDQSTFTVNRSSNGGSLTVASGAGLKIGNTNSMPTNYATHSLDPNSTVEYAGTNQTVAAETYGNLVLSGSGNKTATGTTSVKGNFTLNAGPAFVPSTSTYVFNGSGAQTITGAPTFNNLTMNNASGLTLASGNLTVSGQLGLTAGVIATGSNAVVANGSVTGASSSSYVNGQMTRSIATGSPSVDFAVGDAGSYTPLTAAFASVTGAGSITASTAGADHTSIATSDLDPANDANRTWTLTPNGGLAFSSYNLTMNYAAGDLDPGATTNLFVARNFSGGTWSAPAGGSNAGASSVTGNGFTGTGDFVVGALYDTVGPVTSNASATPALSSSAPTVTAQADDQGTHHSNIATAEYFIDTVGANGTGTPMAASDGAYDSSSEALTATLSAAQFSALTDGQHTIYVHAEDASNNWGDPASTTFTKDTTAPVITTPGNLTAEATGPGGANVIYTAPSATDAIDGTDVVLCGSNSGDPFPIGTTTVNCTSTDAAGNLANATFHVTVQDTTAPVVTVPSDMTLEATGTNGAAATFSASALDLVDGTNDTTACVPASGSTFPLGTTTVHCSATDVAGNTGSNHFDVVVQDTTPPVVTVPADMTVEATGPDGAIVSFTPTAADIYDGTAAVTCVPAAGSTFALGTTTVNCSATDASNNTGSGHFDVLVQDTTAPLITTPGNLAAEATSSAGAVVNYTAPAATDAVDGTDIVGCDANAGDTFPLGVTTVHCTTTDHAGNPAAAHFTVTVHDLTAPAILSPGNQTAEATGPDGAVVNYTAPTATDAVDGTDVVTCDSNPGDTFAIGVTTVECSTADHAGNPAATSFTVTVADTTAPVVTVPTGMTVEATSADGAVVSFDTSSTDAVDGTVDAVTCSPESGTTFALGTTTVNCSATDASNNTGTAHFDVLVRDTTAPVITVPSDISVEATGADGAMVDFTAPSATDAVDGAADVVTCDHNPGDTFALGTTLVSCSATDAHSNTGHAHFNVSVGDTTPPVITVPSDMTLEATGPGGAIATYAPTANDTVDGAADVVSCSPASGSTFAITTTQVNCSATDVAGNTGHNHFTVTVEDTTAPLITSPGNQTAEATSPDGAAVNYTDPSATDAVDGTDPVICGSQGGDTFPLGTTTVHCLTIDAAGNGASTSFTVTVVDTTAPEITTPGNLSIEATGPDGATVNYTAPSATDAVDGTDAVICSSNSGDGFGFGPTEVDCSSTDLHGNEAHTSFVVTVHDLTAPVITVPSDISVEATGADGATVDFTAPSASDAVDGAADVVTCDHNPGDTFALGTTLVSCSATDAHSNTGHAHFDVSVGDTTPPMVTVPSNITTEATSAAGAVVNYDPATANDAVDGAIDTVTCSPVSGSTFAITTTQVNCSATDAAGNTGTNHFAVTVHDTTPPVITTPVHVTAEATGPDGAVVDYTAPSATDIVDGTDAVLCGFNSGDTFPIGTTTVNCVSSDLVGNPATAHFDVTVQDTTAPEITSPGNQAAEATSPDGAAVNYTAPSATDAVDGTDTVTCDSNPGDTFPIGVTPVSCSTVDAHGNPANVGFTVTVHDLTAPVITVPSDISVEATGADGATVDFTAPAASDLVDGAADVVTCDHNSGDTFGLGTTLVSCSATDAHNNTGHAHFNVSVGDTTPPSITPPGDITAEATGASGAVVNYTTPGATDGVDGSADIVTCSPVSGSTFAIATTEVDCSATDAAGNTGTASFHVKVRDTSAPVVSVPSDMTVEATGPSGATVTYDPATANDIVDGAADAVTCSPLSGSTFAITTTEVDCSATDAHGNTGTMSFNVTVQDTTAPAIVVPSDMTVEATGASGAVVNFTTSATDAVDGTADVVTCSPQSGSTFAITTTLVSCSATDAIGNIGHAHFNVTVHDTSGPSIAVPADITLEATGASGAVATYIPPTATDVVDGTDVVTCSANSGDTFPIGATTVNCSAADLAGNPATASFTVTVQDSSAPSITVPSDITLEATGASGAVATYIPPTATDVVDGAADAVTCSNNSGDTFPIGATTVNCSATDAHGNTGHASFHVTVGDSTAPVVTVPSDITTEATGASGAVVNYTAPSASDVVDGAADVVTCTNNSGDTFPIGATTVNCSATDAHGNTGHAHFSVTVGDSSAPVITVPSDITTEATGASGAVVNYTAPSATDTVDGTDAVLCGSNSGDTFPIGTTTVQCAASDLAGNTGHASFHVTVGDTTAPVITVPSDMTLEATGPSGAGANFTAPTATDAVDGTDAVTCGSTSGSGFPVGTTTVNCSSTDAHGNTGHASFKVTVQDTTAPVVTVPANANVEATGPSGAGVSFTAPSATDAVDGTDAVTCGSNSGDTFPIGTTTVNCSATDAHGNTGQASFTVTVFNTAPALQPISDQAVNELSLLTLSAHGSDVDVPAQTLTYSLASGTTSCGSVTSCAVPAGASIDPASGVFSWTPTAIQGPGTYRFKVVVSDGIAQTADELTVTVNDVVVSAPSLAFTSAPQTVGATLSSHTVTVQRLSGTGVAQTAGTLVVNLSSSSAGVFRNTLDTTNITSVTIADGASTASFRYRDAQVGTPTMTAASAGYTSATQGVTVMAPQLVFTTSPQSMAPGGTSGVMTVQREAFDGTLMTSGAQTLNLASSTSTGSFRNSGNTATITTVAIADGASAASFLYRDSAAGTPTITVSSGIFTPATQVVTLTAPPVLVFTTAAMTTAPNVSTGQITIRRQTAGGTPITTGSLTVGLAKTAATGSFRNAADSAAITSITIASGASTAIFRYRDSAVGSPKITASASGYTSASQTETIKTMSKLVFTTTAKAPAPNATSSAITIQRQSSTGAAQTAGSLTVQLTTSSTTGRFVSATTNAIVTSVTIPAGSSTASFRYKDSASGAPVITASATNYVPVKQTERIDVPPTITGFAASYTTARNAAKTISFTVGDSDQGAGAVTMTGTSSNTTIVQSISFSGSGSNRSIKITPRAGKSGTVTITVKASDGFVTTTRTFTLRVS